MDFLLTSLELDILESLMKDASLGRQRIAAMHDITEGRAKALLPKLKNLLVEVSETELEELLTKKSAQLTKQNQRLMDQQRIERKIRDSIRVGNAVDDYGQHILSILREKRTGYNLPKHEVFGENWGILQISDTHFNELIDIGSNKYDFHIAAKRLQKLVHNSISLFKSQNIQNVLVAITGDLINSDRRIDELLNMSTNRAKATMLAVSLLEQVILELSNHFNISVSYVSGNESRVGDNFGTTEIVISDNYDTTIYEILKLIFRETEVKFIDGPSGEKVINVCGKNILMIHGHQIRQNAMQNQLQKIRGKYSDAGIKVDYIIFGHIHECLIADYYARSSSLCGANGYSSFELQFSSRASQNIHIVSETGINTLKIDVQDADDYEGYSIDTKLEEYDALSVSKIEKKIGHLLSLS